MNMIKKCVIATSANIRFLKKIFIDQYLRSRHSQAIIEFNEGKISRQQCEVFYDIVTEYFLNRHIDEGAIVECGVRNGSSSIALYYLTHTVCGQTDRPIYLFDSFEGLPAPTEKDGERAKEFEGKCFGEIKNVTRRFENANLFSDAVHMIKGWLPGTLSQVTIEKIALLHMDLDFYESTLETLKVLYDRVLPGGLIIFDDFFVWQGCHEAVTEFLKERQLNPTLYSLSYGHYKAMYFFKP